MKMKQLLTISLLLIAFESFGATAGEGGSRLHIVNYCVAFVILVLFVFLIVLIYNNRKSRKKHQNELEFVKRIVASIDGVVALVDNQGNFIQLMSDTIWNMTNNHDLYDIGRYVKNKEELEQCFKMIERVCSTHKTEQLEVEVEVLGKCFFVKVSVVWYDESRLVLCMADNTMVEKRRQEDARHMDTLNALLRNIPAAILVKDVITRKYIIANRMAEDMFGVELGSLRGRTLEDREETQVVEQIKKLENEALGNKSVIASGVVNTKKGALLCSIIVLNVEGNKEWIVSTATNISDLIKKERAITKLNQELMMIQKSLELATWSADIEHKSLYINLSHFSFRSLFFDRQELTIPLDFFADKIAMPSSADVLREFFIKLVNGEIDSLKVEVEVVSTSQEGVNDWVEIYGIVTERGADKKAKLVIGGAREINDRKRKEKMLEESMAKAEAENVQKSSFLANMGHEIRTPLNAIVGFSELLVDIDNADERQKYLEIIKTNNNNLIRLVNDILDLSKIEAGVMDVELSDVEVNHLFDVITSVFNFRMTNEVKLIVEKGLETCVITTDQGRLNQAISNFVTNAIKFTEKGSITIGYKVVEDNQLKFYVTDTGVGLTPEQKGAVFGRFVRFDKSKPGTGLGLAITSKIVELLGGTIGVDSEVGVGSTFWIKLPYDPDKVSAPIKDTVRTRRGARTPSPANQIVITKGEASHISEKYTILIAEDNLNNYQLVASVLKDYVLVHAWNGLEAVEMFKKVNPDIVLMDIKMPEMDGFGATTLIRSLNATIPIIAVTAYATLEGQQLFQEYQFSGFVEKPVKFDVLQRAIDDALKAK